MRLFEWWQFHRFLITGWRDIPLKRFFLSFGVSEFF
jgi:hypothetical protein